MSRTATAQAYTEARLQRVLAMLRAHGCRMTPQRAAVVRELVSSTEHPSAHALFARLAPAYPMMSQATVYKTIALLKEIGEVGELPVDGDGMHYDGRRPEPHPHVICTRCGRIVDVEIAEIDALTKGVAAQSGFAQVGLRLEFWGVCAGCHSGE